MTRKAKKGRRARAGDFPLGFGRHRGQPIREVPESYLQWAIRPGSRVAAADQWAIRRFFEECERDHPGHVPPMDNPKKGGGSDV